MYIKLHVPAIRLEHDIWMRLTLTQPTRCKMAGGGGAMSFRLTGRSAASKNLRAHTSAKIYDEEDEGESKEGAKDYVLSLEGQEIQRLVGN